MRSLQSSYDRVEHNLHELLNSLLKDYAQSVSILEELRNACNPKAREIHKEKLVY